MKIRKNSLIHIEDRSIGDGHPTFIIAEAGTNHNGKIELAKKLVDLAFEAGADAVKFQMRDFDTLYTMDTLVNIKNQDIGVQYILPLIKDSELIEDEFKELADYCKEKKIIFLCTPWDIKSVDVLEKIGVPAYKIASADMVNFQLLEYVVSKRKPIIVSTGMSTSDEINNTVKFLRKLEAEFILLHCNSSYPSSPKDLNLNFIQTLKNKFNCIVGYSGHELGLATTLAAIPLGAKVIERHITLDRTMTGPDHAISLESAEVTELIRDIRRIEEALSGDKKYITSGEYINKKTLSKSLVAAQTINKGEVLTSQMIAAKSPAKGVSPQRLFELVGKKAKRDMNKDDYFLDYDFGKKPIKRDFTSKRTWALIVRPHDFEEIIRHNKPPAAEFHFSSQDISNRLKFNPHKDIEFIAHVPDLWTNKLLDLCSENDESRKKSIENVNNFLNKIREVKKYFKKSSKIKVIVHPGGMSRDGFVSGKEKQNMYDRLEDSLKKINKENIELLLENLPPFPWYKGGQWFSNIFTNAKEIAAFCKKNKCFACYDTSHAQLYCTHAKKDHTDFFRKIKSFIRHIHISDAIGTDGEGIQIGNGDLPLDKLAKEIATVKAGFSPEIWMGHRNNGEGFWIALSKLKKYKI